MSVGCASQPHWFAKSTATPDTGGERISRMLNAAQQCEQDGKRELARKMYEHVLVQQPDNPVARARLEELTKQSSSYNGSYYAQSVPRRSPTADERLAQMQARMRQFPQHPGAEAATLAESKPAATPAAATDTADHSATSSEKKLSVNHPLVAENFPTPAAVFPHSINESSNREATPIAVEPVIDSSTPAWARTATVAEPAEKKSGLLPEVHPAYKEEATGPSPLFVEHAFLKDKAIDSRESLAVVSEPQRAEIPPVITPEVASTDAAVKVDPATTAITPADGWTPSSANSRLTQVAETGAESAVEIKAESETVSLAELCSRLPEDFSEVSKMLLDESPDIRIAGLNELADVGAYAAPVTPVVLAMLEDQDARTCVHAAATLHAISGDIQTSVATLTAHLSSQDIAVVRLATYLLGQLGPEASAAREPLAKLRDGGETLTRLFAAEALLQIAPDDTGSMTTLRDASRHADSQVRWFAAVSLGTVPKSQVADAVECLTCSLKDTDAEVRAAAALSLGGFGEHGRSAVAALEFAAETDLPEVREAATLALNCLNIE